MLDQIAIYIAPITYLYSLGLLAFFGLGALLLYKALLPSWVETARHPSWLRPLVAWTVGGVYLVMTLRLWFWRSLFLIAWGYDPVFGWPLLFWIVLVVWIITLSIVFIIARKPGHA